MAIRLQAQIPPSARRRGFLQFRLRTLMVISAIIAILAGWIGREVYLGRLQQVLYERLRVQRDVTETAVRNSQEQVLARSPTGTSHVSSTSSAGSPNDWRMVTYRSGTSDDAPALWHLEVRGSADGVRTNPIVIVHRGGTSTSELIEALVAEYQRLDWPYEIQSDTREETDPIAGPPNRGRSP